MTAEQRAALDSDSLSFFDLMASRVPDGRRLYAAFRPTSAGAIVIAPALQIAPGDLAEVEKTARLWLQWFETLFSEPEADNPIVVARTHGVCVFGWHATQRWRVRVDRTGIL